MQVSEIEYNHAHKPIHHNQPHAITGDINSFCETCAIGSDNLKEIEFRGSPEINMYICVLCSTLTYFSKKKNLLEHVKRFHKAFNQDEKGEKQKNNNSEDEGHLIKQVKIQHINDDDWRQMGDALKALEEDIQEDVSPKQLRWD